MRLRARSRLSFGISAAIPNSSLATAARGPESCALRCLIWSANARCRLTTVWSAPCCLPYPARRIAQHQRCLKTIRKANSAFQKLERLEREWLRLQGKETVYTVDVELDQIMTYFRVSLVNLYSYLAGLLGLSPLSLVKFIYTVLFLSGRVEETRTKRHVILERNEKDPSTMAALSKALSVINSFNIHNLASQQLTFGLE